MMARTISTARAGMVPILPDAADAVTADAAVSDMRRRAEKPGWADTAA